MKAVTLKPCLSLYRLKLAKNGGIVGSPVLICQAAVREFKASEATEFSEFTPFKKRIRSNLLWKRRQLLKNETTTPTSVESFKRQSGESLCKDVISVITLTLLHPLQSVPVQSWTFEPESVIRIGRSTDNEVILYSAVVSRHHVELRRSGSDWEIVSLGANGTYMDGKRITQMLVVDGMIIRIASSGPKIQIHIEGETTKAKRKAALGKRSPSQQELDPTKKETFINSQSTQAENEE